jgi:hypothetical protein
MVYNETIREKEEMADLLEKMGGIVKELQHH